MIGTLGLARTAAAAALAATIAGAAGPAMAQDKVLRAVMHADLRTIDPYWTTQTIVGIHGMLVYDTLFGFDDNLVPRPQMVDRTEISPDRKTYTFTLRDGLKFHDGSPVTTEDVAASLTRWGKRDTAGQQLFAVIDKLEIVDPKTFRFVLKQPYGLVLDTLGKTGTNVPVIMRKKEAETDPNAQITEVVGSGPFRFARDQWVPGSKAVYVKNKDYVPRAEPASGIAGGKVVNVDRVELVWIADPQTAMSALVNGEIDFYEQPSIDFIPILARSRNVTLMKTGKIASHYGIIRLNHLHPPFDNPKIRQAMYLLINQEDFMRSVIGNPEFYEICPALITCGTPMANEGGRQWMKEYNPKKALQLMREAGYKGEPITVLHATDHHTINPATQVLINAMREAGLTLDIQAMDWGSVVSRRAKREPPAQGGWSIFVTTASGPIAANPTLHTWMGASCAKGLFGWPCEPKVDELRGAWATAETDAERKRIARDAQTLSMENVTYLPWGQWTQPLAYRSDRVSGIIGVTGLPIFWNIAKK